MEALPTPTLHRAAHPRQLAHGGHPRPPRRSPTPPGLRSLRSPPGTRTPGPGRTVQSPPTPQIEQDGRAHDGHPHDRGRPGTPPPAPPGSAPRRWRHPTRRRFRPRARPRSPSRRVLTGSSTSVSRVPGAPPRTSTPPTVPSGAQHDRASGGTLRPACDAPPGSRGTSVRPPPESDLAGLLRPRRIGARQQHGGDNARGREPAAGGGIPTTRIHRSGPRAPPASASIIRPWLDQRSQIPHAVNLHWERTDGTPNCTQLPPIGPRAIFRAIRRILHPRVPPIHDHPPPHPPCARPGRLGRGRARQRTQLRRVPERRRGARAHPGEPGERTPGDHGPHCDPAAEAQVAADSRPALARAAANMRVLARGESVRTAHDLLYIYRINDPARPRHQPDRPRRAGPHRRDSHGRHPRPRPSSATRASASPRRAAGPGSSRPPPPSSARSTAPVPDASGGIARALDTYASERRPGLRRRGRPWLPAPTSGSRTTPTPWNA